MPLPLRGPGFPDAPRPKVNYRAVGRGTGGVCKKRIPTFIKDVDPPTPSSVPTKYQTVLYGRNRERHGFASQAPRFAPGRASATPGPGCYAAEPEPAELELGALVSEVPMRGKGPFASRTPRLPHTSKIHGYVPPGPGTYGATTGSSASPRAASPSACFVLPGAGNPAKYCAEPEPGPGSYLGTDVVVPSGRSAATAVFGSSPRKTMHGQESDRPGPGQYDQVDAEERMRSTQRPSQKRLVHEPLDTETAQLRRGTELLKTLDASPRGTRHDASPRPAEPSGAECDAVPGPGQYDIPRLEVVRGTGSKGLSSFHMGKSHHPRTWRGPAPGPTDYAAPVEGHLGRAKPPLSTMVSRSARFGTPRCRAPGPAYYEVKVERPNSFHLNMENTWVA